VIKIPNITGRQKISSLDFYKKKPQKFNENKSCFFLDWFKEKEISVIDVDMESSIILSAAKK
jgi:hypothetical protein